MSKTAWEETEEWLERAGAPAAAHDAASWWFDVSGRPTGMYRRWTPRQIAARAVNLTEQRARRLDHMTGAEW